MEILQLKGMGWRPDLPDHRDKKFKAPRTTSLPAMVDLRSSMPAVYDQGALGSCLKPGTLIRMADGSEKPIEEVKALDQVVTAEGNVGLVTSTMVRKETDYVIRLILWGHNNLRLTGNHPVLTKRGYIEADNLVEGDMIAMPRFSAETTDVIYPDSFIERRQRVTQERRVNVRAVNSSSVATIQVPITVKSLPPQITLSGAFGRIVGLFLAEGNTDKTKVVWSFNSNEEGTLVSELRSLLQEELGVETRIQRRANSCTKVILYGSDWARFFEALCKTGSSKKALHSELAAGPDNFLEGVLSGWLDGDGHKERDGYTTGTTVSYHLAMNMFDIANKLGYRPSFRWSKAVQNKWAKNRSPKFEIGVVQYDINNNRADVEETHMWRRLRKTEKEPYIGYVFNLSVEGDQSYVAEGIGVHNCTGNSIAAAVEYEQMRQNMPGVVPSRLFIYYNERVIEGDPDQDGGAMIRDGIKSINQLGVCDESLWPYDIDKFAIKPDDQCYQKAIHHRAVQYAAVDQSLDQMRGCLVSGFPFVFGFSVYQSFESRVVTTTGKVPMPQPNESLLGGHAVLAVGYDDSQQVFIVRNSWGPGWGDAGYFYLPYAYLTNPDLADDFWVVQLIQNDPDSMKENKNMFEKLEDQVEEKLEEVFHMDKAEDEGYPHRETLPAGNNQGAITPSTPVSPFGGQTITNYESQPLPHVVDSHGQPLNPHTHTPIFHMEEPRKESVPIGDPGEVLSSTDPSAVDTGQTINDTTTTPATLDPVTGQPIDPTSGLDVTYPV